MSISNQNFGFDRDNLFVVGKDFDVAFVIPDLLVSDVASMDWALFRQPPERLVQQTAAVAKASGSGLALSDTASGLDVRFTIFGTETAALEAAVYFHRLDYTTPSGGQHESGRGQAKLTPRVVTTP